MKTQTLESSLVNPVADYVRRKSYRWQERELPFFEYRIDLFAFSISLGRAVAIELKLDKWQRAVEQALIYQLCADFAYIGLPEQAIRRVDQAYLREHGIGLIGIHPTGRCRQVVAAWESKVLRPHYRAAYIDMLKGAR